VIGEVQEKKVYQVIRPTGSGYQGKGKEKKRISNIEQGMSNVEVKGGMTAGNIQYRARNVECRSEGRNDPREITPVR